MSGLRPVGVFGLKVPPTGLRIEANPGLPAAIQITMAAIDPTEPAITSGDAPARATLKIMRNIFDVVDDSEDEDDDEEDYDDDDIEDIRRRLGITDSDDEEMDSEDEEDSDEEMVNGAGPSDPEKTRKKILAAQLKKLEEDEEDEEMADIPNGINGVAKGKARALDLEGEEEEITEYVVCTLDLNQHYQVPLNIVVGANEECYFTVSGSHTVHLTGNFIVPPQEVDDYSDASSDDDDDDLEARLMGLGSELEDDYEDDSEDDGLDDLADPRITEVDSDEEEEAPELVKAETGKKSKKRAAEEEPVQNKKVKTNAGKAVAAPEAKPEAKKELSKKEKKAAAAAAKETDKKSEASPANGKKVQFAEKLEQGPTPSKGAQLTKKTVQGVQIEDRKAGSGPVAKKGDKIGMRYIGKLKNGQQFDANKKGKPFTFKLGSGEVIKGWDIGVAGMAVGGERRIVVPANQAYGNKAMPGLPANSELTFDLKLISIN